MRIGIDLMGSDQLPRSLQEALLTRFSKDLSLVFFVDRPTSSLLASVAPHQLHISPQTVTAQENPLHALRKKQDATLFEGLKAIRKGELDAFITGGNTGALIAGAHSLLSPFPNIRRPALLAFLPHLQGTFSVLDVGGILAPKKENLLQFARMGASTQKILFSKEQPRVALLNIGEESHKGTGPLKEAYRLLEEESATSRRFHFLGNCEARDVFSGEVDVLITEAFSGNIFLKTAEGLGNVILTYLLKNENLSVPTSTWLQTFDYQQHPGAILVGVDGLVLKCHGSASTQSWEATVLRARHLIESHFLSGLKKECQ